MKDLEMYYNEKFKKEGDPDFKDLAEHQIKALSNSLGFSIWKIEKANIELLKAANIELLKAANSFYKNVLKMFRRRPDR